MGGNIKLESWPNSKPFRLADFAGSSALHTPRTGYFSENDNAVITVNYADGLVCSLVYNALGKEYCEIYFDGKKIIIDDYKELQGMVIKVEKTKTDYPGKGLFEELVEFGNYMNGEINIPIALRQLQVAAEISFKLSVGL